MYNSLIVPHTVAFLYVLNSKVLRPFFTVLYKKFRLLSAPNCIVNCILGLKKLKKCIFSRFLPTTIKNIKEMMSVCSDCLSYKFRLVRCSKVSPS